MRRSSVQPLYVVDAFTGDGLLGNPAGVCPLDAWRPEGEMQVLAHRLGLSETAYFVPCGTSEFLLRWFTPTTEADLCGHATLASAAIYFREMDPSASAVRFRTLKAGDLTVTRNGDLLELDFPAQPAQPGPVEGVGAALGAEPVETLSIPGSTGVAVYADEATVRGLRPDMVRVAALDPRKVIATAPGGTADFVSRCFVPQAGIPEDPVTGSAHTTLVPYWSKRLGKGQLDAVQVSQRGGALYCTDRGGRVGIAGHADIRQRGRIDFASETFSTELAPA